MSKVCVNMLNVKLTPSIAIILLPTKKTNPIIFLVGKLVLRSFDYQFLSHWA